jgi:lysophospholipase L1-like esterase
VQQLKFILGSILAAPIMPLVYYQGNQIRKHFPRLPEAKGTTGVSGAAFSKEMTVVGLGESTMAGVGINTHSKGFIGQFSNALAQLLERKINWKVYAKSGFTAEMTKEVLLPQIEEQAVDLFIISLGGNDTFQLNSPNKWTADVKDLIKALKEKYPETPLLFTTMPPIHTFPAFTGSIQLVLGNLVRIHGAALEETVAQFDQVYYDPRKLDLKEWLVRLPNKRKADFYSDGLHPSTLTFTIWGKEMAELIKKEHEFI